MHAAVERGADQLIILGAGLDTFAYRTSLRHFVRIVEVDHPATQAWKRTLLAAAGIAVPRNLSFAAVDLGTVPLRDALSAAGVNLSRPLFISWLGVVYYLPLESVETTLRSIGSSAEGSELVFDYLVPPHTLTKAERGELLSGSDSVAAAGEPWVTFFEPDELIRKLHRSGFTNVENLNSQALSDRFDMSLLAEYRQGGVMHAKVG